jgi:CheY-like chemotaxis protein
MLVADDNDADIAWLKSVLDQLKVQYLMTIANDGEVARRCLMHPERFDVVILDLLMPVLDGHEVVCDIPNWQALPICFMSGVDPAVLLKHYFPEGCRAPTMVKPVDRKQVLRCLENFGYRPTAATA